MPERFEVEEMAFAELPKPVGSKSLGRSFSPGLGVPGEVGYRMR